LARQNFKFDKRQKEIAKQKKNEEKRLRKIEKRGDGEPVEGEVPEEVVVEETPVTPPADPNDPFADWTLDK